MRDCTNRAIANQCQELADLLTRHTDGKECGLHQTNIDKLQFAREISVDTKLHDISEPIDISNKQCKDAISRVSIRISGNA